MGKMSYEDKVRILIFREIGFEYNFVTNFLEKGWQLSSVKAICLSFFLAIYACAALQQCFSSLLEIREKFDTLRC